MADQCVNVRCCELAVCIGLAQIIRGVSFDCCRCDWVVVYRPAGPGRSSLLRTLSGLCPPPASHLWALTSWAPSRSRHEICGAESTTELMPDEPGLRPRSRVSWAGAGADPLMMFADYGRLPVGREAATRRRQGDGLAELNAPVWDPLRKHARVSARHRIEYRPQILTLDAPATRTLDDRSAKIILAAVKSLVEHGAVVVLASQHGIEPHRPSACSIVVERAG